MEELDSNVRTQEGFGVGEKIVLITFISAVILMTILGNLLVMVAVCRDRQLRKIKTNYFIVSLAFADLLVSVLVMPFGAIELVQDKWIYGEMFCLIRTSLDVLLTTASILHLCCISLDRKLKIDEKGLFTAQHAVFQICCQQNLYQKQLQYHNGESIFDYDGGGTLIWDLLRSAAVPPKSDANTFLQTGAGSVQMVIEFNGSDALLAHFLLLLLGTGAGGNIPRNRIWRYYAICCQPLVYRNKMTPLRIALMLGGCWIIPTFISFLPIMQGWNSIGILDLIEKRKFSKDSNSTYCIFMVNKPYAITCSVVAFYIPFFLMVLAYYRIYVTAREHARQIGVLQRAGAPADHRHQHPDQHTTHRMKTETKAAKTLCIIMGCFCLCWAPFFITNVVDPFIDYTVPGQLWTAFLWLGYINSGLNPFLYAFLNKSFRRAFLIILCCGDEKYRRPSILGQTVPCSTTTINGSTHHEDLEDSGSDFPDQNEHCDSFQYMHVKLEEYNQPERSTKEIIKEKAREYCKRSPKVVANFFLTLFPVLQWLPRYKIKKYLPGDITSGIVVGIVTIPQSIAYSLLANQDPIYGIYTNFFCCIIYFLTATSRHNCVGTYGVLCLMVGESVNKQLKAAGYITDGTASMGVNSTLANGTICDRSCYAITVATSLTFIVGVYQILMGIFQLGFISMYLSEPLLSGFVTGSSLTILTSQMKYLLGLKIPGRNGEGALVMTWIDIFSNIASTNICDLVTSIIAIAAIIPVKEINDRFKSKMKIPFPIELIVLIVATLVSHYFNFNTRYKSSVCGAIPTGFKTPKAPDWSLIPRIAADAVPIAIIGFAMTVSLAEIFAKKHGYTISTNQEMIAIGMCNLIPSFFSCFSSCAALAKSLLRESTGANTQLNGIISSAVLLLVLLAIAPLFYSLQNCILGVITICSLRGALRKFADIPKMWRISKIDTVVWWVSMFASSLISTEIGLLVAVCFSMLCVIFRTQRPRATLLGKVSGTEIYEDQFTYKEVNTIPYVKIFRFDASLYYANKDYFKNSLYSKTGINPSLVATLQRKAKKKEQAEARETSNRFIARFNLIKTVQKPQSASKISAPQLDIHSLIIDCGAMQFIDSVGLGILKEVRKDYEEIGVEVFLVNCNPSVRRSLHDGGYFSNTNGEVELLAFHSVHDAVTFSERKFREKQKEIQLRDNAFSFDPAQAISDDLRN